MLLRVNSKEWCAKDGEDNTTGVSIILPERDDIADVWPGMGQRGVRLLGIGPGGRKPHQPAIPSR